MKWIITTFVVLLEIHHICCYVHIYRQYIRQQEQLNKQLPSDNILSYPKLDVNEMDAQDKYDFQWYVIAETNDIDINKPYKATIWNKNYVIWKNSNNEYIGLDDVCPHKGASLSNGKIVNDNIVCPYHGYEFNGDGCLTKVPGLCFTNTKCHNVYTYNVIEKHGWVYLNTMGVQNDEKCKENELLLNNTLIECNTENHIDYSENIFVEDEAYNNTNVVYLHMDFNCYSRILSENSLDVMHIAYVHTFGNAKQPNPLFEEPPKQVGKYHYKSRYYYKSGEMSMAKRIFEIDDLVIENEFILPHTTIARVYFGDFVSTVVTFALPINERKTKLFVKTYRNFWKNKMGDAFTRNTMYNTLLQDRVIVENIDQRYLDGKFNMKYDKLQNTYKTIYKKLIHRLENKDE